MLVKVKAFLSFFFIFFLQTYFNVTCIVHLFMESVCFQGLETHGVVRRKLLLLHIPNHLVFF